MAGLKDYKVAIGSIKLPETTGTLDVFYEATTDFTDLRGLKDKKEPPAATGAGMAGELTPMHLGRSSRNQFFCHRDHRGHREKQKNI